MCNKDNCSNNCIHDILKTILILQKESTMPECCLETCDKKCLGCTPSMCVYNTRPIMIYTCGCCNKSLEIPTTKDPTEEVTSNVFRIEKLDDNCATFRVLVAGKSPDESIVYSPTNSFFTINLDCVCVLKCLGDTFVETL